MLPVKKSNLKLNLFSGRSYLKNIYFYFLPFVLSLNSLLIAQTYPDYKERSLSEIQDSLITEVKDFNLITATEGSIDPEKYVLGPGDKIFISISGLEEMVFNIIINQEGNLYIPKVGGIDLRNSTLAEGKDKIVSGINRYYKNVDVFVTLMDFRKIKVSLLGNVAKPSSQILPANARLMDLIADSDGLLETSNYRNIKVLGKDGKEEIYDLLTYLRYGDKSQNPYLTEGDVVLVDKVDRMVTIYGEIKYPGIYEYVEGETVSELIELAGGLTLKAREDSIEVVSFDEKGKNQYSRYFSLEILKNNFLELKNQDRIIVRQLSEYFLDRYVKIEGFVNYPGWYKIIKDSTTLKQIIKQSGGFLRDASLSEASLIRSIGVTQYDPEYERLKLIPRADMTDDEYDYLKAKSRERTGKVVVDFVRLFRYGDIDEDVVLKRGDIIEVPEAKNYITLLGQVVNPGKVIYRENLSYEDYINLAGGFGWRALEDEVRVIKVKTGEWVDAEDAEELEPGDTIWVPENPPGPKFWDVFTTALQITGQIAAVVAAMVAVIAVSR
jgi:polysaccharide biosynthesis/export protein